MSIPAELPCAELEGIPCEPWFTPVPVLLPMLPLVEPVPVPVVELVPVCPDVPPVVPAPVVLVPVVLVVVEL